MKTSLLLVAAIIFMANISCEKRSDGSLGSGGTATPPATNPSNLKLIDANVGFNIGCTVKSTYLQSETAYSNVVKGEFNQMTAEYEMKMASIWTGLGQYNFLPVDYIVNYAQTNKMAVHGHVLIWYQSFPQWFKDANYDTVAFERNVKTYITTVVSRYKGKLRSWDVANEIFNDDGTLRVEPQIQGRFKDPIGFIGRCFKYASQADPSVKLFYNDYDVVLASGKRNAIRNMVARFKKEGYPIDGIGEQFHYSISTSATQIANGFADLVSIGTLIHISEADCKVNVNNSPNYTLTSADLQKQSDFFKNIVKLYNAIPARQKFAITLWGVTDKYTWLRTHTNADLEYPLLFDDSYNKKPAYTGFLNGLK